MVKKIDYSYINTFASSVYDFNELTLHELLNKFFSTINETVDISNQALEFLTYLKEEGLPKEVVKEIELMYTDGRLTTLINNLADDVNSKVEKITNDVNTKITDIKINVLPNINIDGGVF